MYKINELHAILRDNGYKLTSVRKEVYYAIVDARQPLNNSEVIERLDNVDRVSVYRTLTLFESIGVITRIWTGFKSKVELGEAFSPHHHHFICDLCGHVTSFKSDNLEKALEKLQAQKEIIIKRHQVELIGYCRDCSTNNKALS